MIGFSYPVVPKDKARIRVQISAAHTEDEIDQCKLNILMCNTSIIY